MIELNPVGKSSLLSNCKISRRKFSICNKRPKVYLLCVIAFACVPNENCPSRWRVHRGCRGVAVDCFPSWVWIGEAYGITLLNVAWPDDWDKRSANLNDRI